MVLIAKDWKQLKYPISHGLVIQWITYYRKENNEQELNLLIWMNLRNSVKFKKVAEQYYCLILFIKCFKMCKTILYKIYGYIFHVSTKIFMETISNRFMITAYLWGKAMEFSRIGGASFVCHVSSSKRQNFYKNLTK